MGIEGIDRADEIVKGATKLEPATEITTGHMQLQTACHSRRIECAWPAQDRPGFEVVNWGVRQFEPQRVERLQ